MAESMEVENASFWLPTHFLTDDFFAEQKLQVTNSMNDPLNHNSYDLFNSGFGSDPFDSPISSPGNDQHDLLLSHLTRHLAHASLNHNQNTTSQKPWVFSTSPQSTLSGFGGGRSGENRAGFPSNGSPTGPSQAPSPPLTPELENDAAWDLLYEAANQVARLKMNAIVAQMNNNGRGLLGTPRQTCGLTPASNNSSHHRNLYNNNQELKWAQNSNNLGSGEREGSICRCRYHQPRRSCGGAMGLPQSAWPSLTTRGSDHQLSETNCVPHMRSMHRGGAGRVVGPTIGGVKRQSVGTGVFLPRTVSTSPPRHRHHQNQPHRSELCRKPTTEFMLARRNAIVGQQRKNYTEYNKAAMVGHGHELRLPNDWSY